MSKTIPLRVVTGSAPPMAPVQTDGPLLRARAGAAATKAAEELRAFRPVIYWYLTFRCNLACTHCWVNSSPAVDTSGDLSTSQAMQVIEQMVDLRVSRVAMSGGEVLVRRDALEIIRATADRG